MVPSIAPKLREDFKSLGGMTPRLESESSYKDWRVRWMLRDGHANPCRGGPVESIFNFS